jgi:hypothetical protein
MADSDSSPKAHPVTLRVAEIHSLADRLTSRAASILLRDQPEQARDIAMAGATLRALLRNVNHSDVVTIENGGGA